MGNSIPVRPILFPEGIESIELEPLQQPAILRLSDKLISRLGRKLLALADSDSCVLNTKNQRYFFGVYQYRPFRRAQVPVEDLKEAIIAFAAERVQEISAEVSELKWSWRQTTGFRLDILLRPENAG